MGNKKILLVIGGAIIIVSVIVIFLVMSRFSASQSKNFTDYASSTFSAVYPISWTTDRRSIAGGGDSFTARVDSKTELFPRFTIESTPYSEQKLKDKLKVLSFYNLSQKDTTFKGYPATQLAGNLHLRFKTGNPEQKPVYKEFILVKGNENLYVISFAYFDDDTKLDAQKKIKYMLDNVKIR